MTFIESAQLFGIVSLLLSLGVLFNLDNSRKMALELTQHASPAGYILAGVLPIIFGTWVITQHSDWTVGWPLVVTLIGWIMMLLGVIRLWFVHAWANTVQKHVDKVPVLFSLFGLMIGLLLSYIGFVSHHL